MTASSFDPVTGAPQFADADAPDVAQNPTEVAEYAASVGTRLIGTTAERTAYAYAREGLRWYDTDTDSEYVHNGSGWVLWGRIGAAYTPTLTNFSGSPTVTARYSVASGRVFVSVNIAMVGANVGTAPGISLPVTARTPVGTPISGRALYRSGATYIIGEILLASTTQVQPLVPTLSGGVYMNTGSNVSATVPFTWNAGTTMTLEFSYEAA